MSGLTMRKGTRVEFWDEDDEGLEFTVQYSGKRWCILTRFTEDGILQVRILDGETMRKYHYPDSPWGGEEDPFRRLLQITKLSPSETDESCMARNLHSWLEKRPDLLDIFPYMEQIVIGGMDGKPFENGQVSILRDVKVTSLSEYN